MNTPPVTPPRPRLVHKRTISTPSPPRRPLSPDMFNGRAKALPSPPIEPIVRNELDWASHQQRLSQFPEPPQSARHSLIHEIGVRQTVDSYFDDGHPAPTIFNWGNGLAYATDHISSVPMVREPEVALRPLASPRPFSVLSPAIQLTAGPFDPSYRPVLARRFVSFEEVPEFRLKRTLAAKPPFWRRWLHHLKSFFRPKPVEADHAHAD